MLAVRCDNKFEQNDNHNDYNGRNPANFTIII